MEGLPATVLSLLPAGQVPWGTWILVLILPQICCVALSKSLHHSRPEKGPCLASPWQPPSCRWPEAPAD